MERTKTKGDDDAEQFKWNSLTRRGLKIAYDSSDPNNVKHYRPSSVGHALWLLAANCLFFLVLAWYCGQLFSGGEGNQSKPFWFPLSLEYWGLNKINFNIFGRRRRRRRRNNGRSSQGANGGNGGGSGGDGGAGVVTASASSAAASTAERVIYEGDVAAREKWISERDGGVNVHKLSVSYGKVQALRETSFSFAPGQIWALLGHNGAGKRYVGSGKIQVWTLNLQIEITNNTTTTRTLFLQSATASTTTCRVCVRSCFLNEFISIAPLSVSTYTTVCCVFYVLSAR
jgi:ABC-type multidrug transport system fused ATPase/permease subunit